MRTVLTCFVAFRRTPHPSQPRFVRLSPMSYHRPRNQAKRNPSEIMNEKARIQSQGQGMSLPRPANFHHVGFAVASIKAVGAGFAKSLGAEWSGEIIHDPLQEARVTFLRCGGPGTPAVELVEPTGETSPLHKFLSRGGGLHHVPGTSQHTFASPGAPIRRQPGPSAGFSRLARCSVRTAPIGTVSGHCPASWPAD